MRWLLGYYSRNQRDRIAAYQQAEEAQRLARIQKTKVADVLRRTDQKVQSLIAAVKREAADLSRIKINTVAEKLMWEQLFATHMTDFAAEMRSITEMVQQYAVNPSDTAADLIFKRIASVKPFSAMVKPANALGTIASGEQLQRESEDKTIKQLALSKGLGA